MRRWRETQIDGARANSDSEGEIWAQTDNNEAARPEMGTRRGREGREGRERGERGEREGRGRDTLMSPAVRCKSFCCT